MAKPTGSEVQPKPLRWLGSSKEDLSGFPEEVRRRVGGALWDAQLGLKAPYVKPLKGFGDAGVLEILDDFDGDTYRAVYTVRFARIIYVLHAFQKKSKSGVATPKVELNLIELRLKRERITSNGQKARSPHPGDGEQRQRVFRFGLYRA